MRAAVVIALALASAGCLAHFTGPLPGEPAGASYMHVAGARVRYVDVGHGPAVVLVHGFASSLETWSNVIPHLAVHHRVIALDLKGFGWSDRPEGDYSPAAEGRLVWALLDRLGVGRVALVGHSWGASVVLAMALAHPERTTRIALYDAWVFADQLPTFFYLARVPVLGEAMFALWYDERPADKLEHAFYDKDHIPQSLVDAVKRALGRPGTRFAALAAVRGQHFKKLEAEYRTIAKPTLILWGREDEVARLSEGERLLREMPNSRLIVYPRCGHFPMIEAAAASTRDLAAFLDEGSR